MVPIDNFRTRLEGDIADGRARQQAARRPWVTGADPRTRLLLALVLGSLVMAVAVAGWTVATTQTDRNSATARAAVERMVGVVNATPDKGHVDVAQAQDVPWDRAVLIAPLADGTAMNKALGFNWYQPGDISTREPEAQFVVFVQGQTVVAEALLPRGTFRFDSYVQAFTRDHAVFSVVRSEGDTILQP